MKMIEVDDEVYARIMGNTSYRNESESSILRRLLGMDMASEPNSEESSYVPSALDIHLSSDKFRYSKGAVGKFLSILSFIYQQHASVFSRVEVVKGRDRLYFARDEATLTESGRSMQPKPIPGSPYWVTTNTPTVLKQEILSAAMQILGYSVGEIQRARSAIVD